jgi:hypothetical protein
MPDDEFQQRLAKKPAPDQNDPSGRVRPGSPTYHPGNAPEQNVRSENPDLADREDQSVTEEEAEEARKYSNKPVDD